jgi:hypothetical protein
MPQSPRLAWPIAALATAAAMLVPSSSSAATPAQIDAAAHRGGQWLATQVQPDGSLPGFNSDWAIPTLAATGFHPADVRADAGDPSLQDWWHGLIAGDEYALATMQPWTVAGTVGKAALLSASAGIRPTRVAPDVNLAAALATRWDAANGTFSTPQVNSDGFALLAGDLVDLPRGVREKVVALVRASQHQDGGWTFLAGGDLASPGDVDMTGAALAMLCQEGATADDGQVASGLQFLKDKQDAATGGIVAGPFVPPLNSPSNAWALIGLNACDVDADSPAWRSAQGKSITDFLLSVQRADGSFKYVPEDDDAGAPNDVNATEATARALSGRSFSAAPPARAAAGAARWRATEQVAPGTAVPIALGVDDRAGDVRYCGVAVPAGAALAEVLMTAAAASQPAGCVTDAQLSGGRIVAVNGAAAGPDSAWLASVDGAGFAPTANQAAGLGATVALELREWALLPSAPTLDLGAQSRATIGAARTLALTATADGVRPARIDTTGPAADDFLISGDGCTQATLADGRACTVRIRFAPSATGTRTATLLARDSAGDAIGMVELTGTGSGMAVGTPGPAGATGAPGPAGARGPRGKRGREAKVRCTLVRKRGKRKIRCAVRYGSGRKASGTARARLLRDGRVVARGPLARMRASRRVAPGTYTLRIGRAALRVRIGAAR